MIRKWHEETCGIRGRTSELLFAHISIDLDVNVCDWPSCSWYDLSYRLINIFLFLLIRKQKDLSTNLQITEQYCRKRTFFHVIWSLFSSIRWRRNNSNSVPEQKKKEANMRALPLRILSHSSIQQSAFFLSPYIIYDTSFSFFLLSFIFIRSFSTKSVYLPLFLLLKKT